MGETKQVVVAPDKFKGSLSSPDVCTILSSVLTDELADDWVVETSPMADGGEGTVEAVVSALDGEIVTSEVTGPRGSSVEADWGWIPGTGNRPATGVIEMAQASGIELLSSDEQNPMKTTTYGTGELINRALDRGAKKILLGIGGSATVDGGMGMAKALGFEVLDQKNTVVGDGGEALADVETIIDDGVPDAVRNCTVQVACDVNNPLLGENGASRVYGPQKGATPEMVEQLEKNLRYWANVVETYRDETFREIPGTGAAGGLGFGLVGFLNADLVPGAELVMDVTGLNSRLEQADVLITGEGQIDKQTAYGKTPDAVAVRAREKGVDWIFGVAGSLGDGYRQGFENFDWLMALPVKPMSLENCMADAPDLLRDRGRDLAQLIKRLVD